MRSPTLIKTLIKTSSILTACFMSFPVFAFEIPAGKFIVEAGYFRAHQGQNQFIEIQDLIGDRFDVSRHNDNNFVAGIGYILPAMQTCNFSLFYGINAFYLWDTEVKGTVWQEDLFENLAFHYDVRNIPVYLTAKAWFNTGYTGMRINLDAGLGANFISTRDFYETSLDGITLPDDIFRSQSRTTWSGTIGAGLVFDNVLGCFPVELNYRFFYLGEGSLKKSNSQVLNSLRTGDSYANALILSVLF